jgi:hypothetical protein
VPGRVGVHGHVVGDHDFFLVGLNELGQIGQAAAVEQTGRPRGSGIGGRSERTAGGDGGFCLLWLLLLHGQRGARLLAGRKEGARKAMRG